MIIRILPSLLCVLFLWGCSTKEDELLADQPLESLYSQGMTMLGEKKYEKAAKFFDEIERQYPYSDWADQAQLMASYCYYLGQKYDKALTGLETFVQLHPAHTDAAYAYYLIGLCYYEQISAIERDQKVTELALDGFQEVIRRFPTTKYARDARYKMDLLLDTLASKEMQVGRYYQKQKAWGGALNRFKYVVEQFQKTLHVEEALHRLVECYMALDLPHEARKVAVVLGHNYPGSQWYVESYKLLKDRNETIKTGEDNSWLDTLKLSKSSVHDSTYAVEDTYAPPSIDVRPPHAHEHPFKELLTDVNLQETKP